MTRPPLLLGLDAGGSGTKWCLLRDGAAVASGVAPALTSALLDTQAGQRALLALAEALPGRPDAVHAGMPGLRSGSERAGQVRAALAAALNADARRVSLEGDLDLAYRAHLAPGAGILVYAGTGSIAYHVAQGGQVYRAGGYGYRIGDDGGGYSIGRAALRWLTDGLDVGVIPDTPLSRALSDISGDLQWDTLRHIVYGVPGASSVARFAPAVGRAADAGDQVALRLVDEAADSLAALARRIQTRVGSLPVIATGGALRISALFPAALHRHLPNLVVQFRDHAEAAARYAATRV